MERRFLALLSLILVTLTGNSSVAIPIGDFIRNGDGTIKGGFTYFDAKAACERIGRRLPTMTEMAQLATQFGAVILNEKDVRNGILPQGYKSWDVGPFQSKGESSPEIVENIIYGSRQYRPNNELADRQIWTSSVAPELGLATPSYSYRWLFFGRFGYFASFDVDQDLKIANRLGATESSSAWCVQNE